MTEIRKSGQLVAGIVVAALGVVLLFERFLDIEIYGLYRLWPLFVIGFGVIRLIGADAEKGRCKRRSSGLFMIALGIWFLINTLRIYGLDWGESWPVLLMLLGLARLILPEDGRRSFGVLLLLIGAWGFMNVFGIWGFDWDNSWSIVLIIGGVFIVWRALFEEHLPREAGGD